MVGLTIGLLGHQRPDKGWQFAPDFVPVILQRHVGARIIAHQSDPESMVEATEKLRRLAAREPRLELLVQPAVREAWFDLLDRCDIVALPYDPQRYQTAYSAIVGEALAAGAPVVVPAATTMSAALETAGGPGTTFVQWDAASIAAGITHAIGHFDELAGRAYRAGLSWRERHGPDRFAVAVIEAAGRTGAAPPTGPLQFLAARLKRRFYRLFGRFS